MRNRVAILTIAAVLPLTATASLAAASQAVADPRSGEVVVTGVVDDCENGDAPLRVQITAGQETSTDENRGVRTNAYSATFQNVPKDGVAARATVTCEDDSYEERFKIKRPAKAGDLVQRVKLAP